MVLNKIMKDGQNCIWPIEFEKKVKENIGLRQYIEFTAMIYHPKFSKTLQPWWELKKPENAFGMRHGTYVM